MLTSACMPCCPCHRKVSFREFSRSPAIGCFERPNLMKQSLPSGWRRLAVPTLITIGVLLSVHCSNAQDTIRDGGTMADSAITDVNRIPDQMDENIIDAQSNIDRSPVQEGQARSMDHPPLHHDESHTERHQTDSKATDPPGKDITSKNHDESLSAFSENHQLDEPGPDPMATEEMVSENIDGQKKQGLEVDPNLQARINREVAEEYHQEISGIPRETHPFQDTASAREDLPLTGPRIDDRDSPEKEEAMHTKDDERIESSKNQGKIKDQVEFESSAKSPSMDTHEMKQESNTRATDASIDITKEEYIVSEATDDSKKENTLPHKSLVPKGNSEMADDLIIEDTPESTSLDEEENETQSLSEAVSAEDDTPTKVPPEQSRNEPQSMDSKITDSSPGPDIDSKQEKGQNDEQVRAPCDNETRTSYCGVWGTFRSERSYADLKVLQLLFQGLDRDEQNATNYLSYLASSESGKVDLPFDEGLVSGEPAEESINEDLVDGSPFSKTPNTQFVEGLDDIDKIFEDIDPPDELDVAPGSSLQEVIMGQGTRIVLKRLSMAFRAVKTAFVETKHKVVETKDELMERIHSDKRLHLPFDTDDVVHVLENIWETTVRASVAIREAIENIFEDDGVARRIWKFAVDAVHTAQSTIDDILEGSGGEAEEELQEMASKLRQTTGTTGPGESDTSVNDQIQEIIRKSAERER